MKKHYGRHYLALPKFVNHKWYMLCHSHDKHKRTNNKKQNKQAIGLKPETTWSQVEHSTTASMGKEGMIHELSSFHKCN